MVHVISGISLIGITVCSFALITILSVFNGFEDIVSKLYNTLNSDLKVVPAKGKYFSLTEKQIASIRKFDFAETLTPVIEENALLKYRDKQTIAAFKAIDPPYMHSMHIDTMVLPGGDPVIRDGEYSFALVGTGVALKLGLPGRDDFNPIQVFVPRKGDINILNPEAAFNRRSIPASGKFSTVQEFDEHYIIVPLSFARTLMEEPKRMTGFEINLKKDEYLGRAKERVQSILGPSFLVLDRYEQQSTTFKVMKSEKFFVYLMLTFIMVIAAFNMVGSLLMLAIDKKQDMMALLSMGATMDMLESVIFYEGLLLSLIGGIAGIIFGFIAGLLQKEYGFIKINGAGDTSTFVLSAYPVSFRLMDFIIVLATVVLLGFFASWYPAKSATKRLSILDLRGN